MISILFAFILYDTGEAELNYSVFTRFASFRKEEILLVGLKSLSFAGSFVHPFLKLD
jgi:hypothetical protein